MALGDYQTATRQRTAPGWDSSPGGSLASRRLTSFLTQHSSIYDRFQAYDHYLGETDRWGQQAGGDPFSSPSGREWTATDVANAEVAADAAKKSAANYKEWMKHAEGTLAINNEVVQVHSDFLSAAIASQVPQLTSKVGVYKKDLSTKLAMLQVLDGAGEETIKFRIHAQKRFSNVGALNGSFAR